MAPTQPIDRITEPLAAFARHKLAGAALLLAATVLAMIWANSPWKETYVHWLEIEIEIRAGAFAVGKSLHHWINDGLMGVFFFLVGLEVKRELIAGELSVGRKALLPIVAAVGGMVVPAALYLSQNSHGPGTRGWGIPMATDIAFALGVLALAGSRAPAALKVFLTALAIVDDIGAILVIAVFYTEQIHALSLVLGGGLWAVSLIANRLGIRSSVFYFLLGTFVWLAFLKSGVHATLAAVLMAMTIPVNTRATGQELIDRVRAYLARMSASNLSETPRMLAAEQLHLLADLERTVDDVTPPLQKLEHAIVPLVTFLILPVFALANAGVDVSGVGWSALSNPIAVGIGMGLFVGKQLGIVGFSWLVIRLGQAELPAGVSWRQIHAVAVLAGIGFTMSLFIGSLAFSQPAEMQVVKVAVLGGSALSAIVGLILLRRG